MNSISSQEFFELLHSFSLEGNVAVAVSGGADSMALCLLLHAYTSFHHISFHALTVDHQLRSESFMEAQQVHEWLKARGISHHILTWQHEGVEKRIQERARHGRYELMSKWCQDNHMKYLFTAHHLLDQWETFMMRLGKGSGLRGLCCMKSYKKTAFGYLVRPLLNIHPNRLKLTLERFEQDFLKDPSNEKDQFTRIRFRKNYEMFAALGVTAEAIQKTIENFKLIDDFMEEQIQHYKKQLWCMPELELTGYKKSHATLRYRLMNEILLEVGQAHYPISHSMIKRIDDMIMEDRFKTITAGHCLMRQKKKYLLIQKEMR